MENKKFMLGDEPKSYPPSPPSQTLYRHKEQNTTSSPPSIAVSTTATTETSETPHTSNNSGKRSTRHLAKRRSAGARYMKRTTSMEDTSKARIRRSPSHQRLQSFCPMPIMTQLSDDPRNNTEHQKDQQQEQQQQQQQEHQRPLSNRNDSNTSITTSRTAPSSFIVSSMECAKPVEQTLHATAKSLSPRPPINVPYSTSTGNNETPCSSATEALLYVSESSSPSNIRQPNKSVSATTKQHNNHQRDQQREEHGYQRRCLTSRFIQQPPTSSSNFDNEDKPYQKMLDDQYRDLQQYHHPMLTSLMRCLCNKQVHQPSSASSTPLKTSSSAIFVPTTTTTSQQQQATERSTGTNHQRHHSHSVDYPTLTAGSQLQQQPIHADQRLTIHKNHMKKVLVYNYMQHHHHHHPIGLQSSATQQGPSIVSSSDLISPAKRPFALSMASSSASTSSPWVTSIWGRVWNGLIKA